MIECGVEVSVGLPAVMRQVYSTPGESPVTLPLVSFDSSRRGAGGGIPSTSGEQVMLLVVTSCLATGVRVQENVREVEVELRSTISSNESETEISNM